MIKFIVLVIHLNFEEHFFSEVGFQHLERIRSITVNHLRLSLYLRNRFERRESLRQLFYGLVLDLLRFDVVLVRHFKGLVWLWALDNRTPRKRIVVVLYQVANGVHLWTQRLYFYFIEAPGLADVDVVLHFVFLIRMFRNID